MIAKDRPLFLLEYPSRQWIIRRNCAAHPDNPLMHTGDVKFLNHVTGRLAGVPAVCAVALGGSRAAGTHRPDSDWDFSVYYRGHFDPGHLRALGWPGEV